CSTATATPAPGSTAKKAGICSGRLARRKRNRPTIDSTHAEQLASTFEMHGREVISVPFRSAKRTFRRAKAIKVIASLSTTAASVETFDARGGLHSCFACCRLSRELARRADVFHQVVQRSF